MRSTKTIAVVGASEETVAHLRLLMRMGQNQLRHHWRWGHEDAADFVAVEVADLGCEGVLARCQAAGVPCAVMAEADDVVVHGLVLRRPFKLDQIVAVLNTAATASADAGEIEAFAEDFYLRELEDFQPPASSSDDVWARQERTQATAPSRSDVPAAAPDLDRVIHGDPLAEPPPRKPLVTDETTLEKRVGEPSRRSLSRADEARHRVPAGVIGVEPVDVAPIVIPPRQDGSIPVPSEGLRMESGEKSGHRLLEFLAADLVYSPSQLALDGLPSLILDPKSRRFHSPADLGELEGWFRQAVPPAALRGITSTELARAREVDPGRDYEQLVWLDALLQSNGHLSGRLDPGGSYAVTQPFALAPAYRAHARIAAAMASPARLHEIAARSGASMMQVYDVVNAYDRVGRLHWTPRQRFAVAEAEPRVGGLSRLWPFGKR